MEIKSIGIYRKWLDEELIYQKLVFQLLVIFQKLAQTNVPR